VRIEETTPVVDLAIGKMSLTEKPEARLLPVDPTDKYPLEAIKDVVEAKKFDFKPYFFNEADFQVTLITPLMRYRAESEAKREAEKTKNKRTKSKDSLQSTSTTTDKFHNWAEYVGEYKPILIGRSWCRSQLRNPQTGELTVQNRFLPYEALLRRERGRSYSPSKGLSPDE